MYENIGLTRGGTLCLSRSAVAEGTAAATLLLAAPNGAGTDFAIDGLIFHKADVDNIAMNAQTVQAISTTCLYAVQLDSAGAVTIKKGVEVPTLDLTNGVKVLNWPLPDAARCAIGYIKIVTGAAATFTSGTTDLSAAGITATYNSVVLPPVAPLTS